MGAGAPCRRQQHLLLFPRSGRQHARIHGRGRARRRRDLAGDRLHPLVRDHRPVGHLGADRGAARHGRAAARPGAVASPADLRPVPLHRRRRYLQSEQTIFLPLIAMSHDRGGTIPGGGKMATSEWHGRSSGVVIAGLVGSAFGAGPIIFYSLPLLMRPVTEAFHWSLADFSLVQGIASITVAILSPFLGYLTDRWGARAIMLPGILAFGIANFLLSLLNGSLTELYLFWFLIGLSAAFVGPVAYSKLISAWFYRRRGLALGVSIGIG